MKHRRRSLTSILTLAIALVVTLPSSGQEQAPLAELGPIDLQSTTARAPRPTHTTYSPITDDRHRGDERLPTNQIVIAFDGETAQSVAVDILDEHGQRVQQHAFSCGAGRNALPVDVSGLEKGRYAVRVQNGSAMHVSRFRRD